MTICKGREKDQVSYRFGPIDVYEHTARLTRCGALKTAWSLIWSAIRNQHTYLTSHRNF